MQLAFDLGIVLQLGSSSQVKGEPPLLARLMSRERPHQAAAFDGRQVSTAQPLLLVTPFEAVPLFRRPAHIDEQQKAHPQQEKDCGQAHAAIVDLLDLCLQLPLSLAEQIDAVLELGNLVRQAGNVLAGRSVGIAYLFVGCGSGRGIACA